MKSLAKQFLTFLLLLQLALLPLQGLQASDFSSEMSKAEHHEMISMDHAMQMDHVAMDHNNQQRCDKSDCQMENHCSDHNCASGHCASPMMLSLHVHHPERVVTPFHTLSSHSVTTTPESFYRPPRA